MTTELPPLTTTIALTTEVFCILTDSCEGCHYTCDNVTLTVICNEGYGGENCKDRTSSQFPDSECPGNGFKLCSNGGTCWNGQCCCPPGLTGEICTDEIDECESQPCKNGGTCVQQPDITDKYICYCPDGIYIFSFLADILE